MPYRVDAQAFPEQVTATTSRFINRELSWLEFDARVLALAEDPARPLLERVKFVAIYTQNLDEFFQIRVSGLEEQVEAGVAATTPDGMGPQEQLEAIRERVVGLQGRADELVQGDLLPALEKERIRVVHWEQLSDADREFLGRRFRERIFPVLTPLSVDPSHPFPYISNLSLNLAAAIRDPKLASAGSRGSRSRRCSLASRTSPTASASCRSRKSSRPTWTSSSRGWTSSRCTSSA